LGLFDGFHVPENISPYFSLEEKMMWNVIQVVSYFSEHLGITYEFPNNYVVGTYS